MSRCWAPLLTVGAMLLWTAPSLASAGIATVSYEEALKQAPIVAVARLGPDKRRQVQVPFAGRTRQGKAIPVFVRNDTHLEVAEVVRNRSGKPTPRQVFVAPAEWSTRRTVHRRYHEDGTRKIPLYHRLDGGGDGMQALSVGHWVIVLLAPDEEAGLRFAVGMGALPIRPGRLVAALEGLSKKERAALEGLMQANEEPPIPSHVASLGWLAGTWRGKGPGGIVEELWSRPQDGSMMGSNRTFRDKRTVAFEHLRIVDGPPRSEGVKAVYIAQPSGKSPGTPFGLEHVGKGKRKAWIAEFTNRAHDFPQRLRYVRMGKALLIVVTGDGEPLVFRLKAAR